MANPKQSHWIAMKKIFHYLKCTLNFGLGFKRNIKDLLWARCIMMKILNVAMARYVLKGINALRQKCKP